MAPSTDRTTYSPRCCAATRAGVRSSWCSCSNADAQPASHPRSSKTGKASLLCERVKLETRASAEAVRLDEEPRALRKEVKRNRHQCRPPCRRELSDRSRASRTAPAAEARAVLPAGIERVADIAYGDPPDGAERMNSHWSAPRQST